MKTITIKYRIKDSLSFYSGGRFKLWVEDQCDTDLNWYLNKKTQMFFGWIYNEHMFIDYINQTCNSIEDIVNLRLK